MGPPAMPQAKSTNRTAKRHQKKLARKAARKNRRAPPPQPLSQVLGAKLEAALSHHQAGRLDQAKPLYAAILSQEPSHAEALRFLDIIAYQEGDSHQAVALIGKAIALRPDFFEAHSNLGLAHHALGQFDEAVASYRKALDIKPDCVEAHNNLGLTLHDLGKLDAAVAGYTKALAIKSDFTEAHNNLGNSLRDLGQLEEAAASYRKALAINPGFAEAHFNLGRLQLLTGGFQDGWKNYAWRWQWHGSGLRPREYQAPFWDGSALDGKTILIYPEQGVGDTIQFARYLPFVEALGARVVFEVPKTLDRLFKGSTYEKYLVGSNETPPSFDCHAPLLDLPRLLNTTLETIPVCDNFLNSPSELREVWSDRIGPSENIRVGIVWAGNPKHANDRNRSIEAALFRPLTEIPGVSTYSLQVGRDGEAAEVFGDRATDIAPFLTDFAETAAAIGQLDLIVTADTSVAHLAGTLRTPVWTLLPFIPDWRWLLERDDSPWYPSMRLFRQRAIGDWAGVFEEVGKALREFDPV